LEGTSLVIVDCEGFEDDLLVPDRVFSLRHAHVLVELHEKMRRGVTARILERFRGTHEPTIIDTVPRTAGTYVELQELEGNERLLAISELRPEPQQWAYLRPVH